MDSRDNRGKAKKASKESSRKKPYPSTNPQEKGKSIATDYCDIKYPETAIFQQQNFGTISNICPPMDMLFGQQYQRPLYVGNAGLAPYMTAIPNPNAGSAQYMTANPSGNPGFAPYMIENLNANAGIAPYMTANLSGNAGFTQYMTGNPSVNPCFNPYMTANHNGNAGLAPYTTANPAYNSLQQNPNFVNQNSILSADVGGYRSSYNQELCNESFKVLHSVQTLLDTVGRGPSLQSNNPTFGDQMGSFQYGGQGPCINNGMGLMHSVQPMMNTGGNGPFLQSNIPTVGEQMGSFMYDEQGLCNNSGGSVVNSMQHVMNNGGGGPLLHSNIPTDGERMESFLHDEQEPCNSDTGRGLSRSVQTVMNTGGEGPMLRLNIPAVAEQMASILHDKQEPCNDNGRGLSRSVQPVTNTGSEGPSLQSDISIVEEQMGSFVHDKQEPCNNNDRGLSRSVQPVMYIGGKGPLSPLKIPVAREYMESSLNSDSEEVISWIEKVTESWPRTGCSIILDGWDNIVTGKTRVNLLVDNPLGTVYMYTCHLTHPNAKDDVMILFSIIDDLIKAVEANNVHQIISYANTPWLNDVKTKIQNKYKFIFWTVNANYCLAMIMERVASSPSWVTNTIEKAKKITRLVHSHTFLLDHLKCRLGKKKEDYYLVKHGKIRQCTPFMTLENLLLKERDLRAIFDSQKWKKSSVGSSERGKEVENLVKDNKFWEEVRLVVKGGMPIVNVTKLFNDEKGPLMGLLYETMDQLNETIDEEIQDDNKTKKLALRDIINDVWNKVLHSPVHAAGYYLNPSLHNAEKSLIDSEVESGLKDTISKFFGKDTQQKIRSQLEPYKEALGSFTKEVCATNELSPVEWWRIYWDECPDLQSFAIKVLELSCNGTSCYGLRADDANPVDEVGPVNNKSWRERYVPFNAYLRNLRQSERKFDMVDPEANPSDDDWIVGDY